MPNHARGAHYLDTVLIGSNGLAKNQTGDDEIDRRRTSAATILETRGGATGTNQREGPALFDGGVRRRRPQAGVLAVASSPRRRLRLSCKVCVACGNPWICWVWLTLGSKRAYGEEWRLPSGPGKYTPNLRNTGQVNEALQISLDW